MIIHFKRLHPEATMPTRGSPGSVGLDLYAHLLTEQGRPNTALIPPRTTKNIPTGLAVLVPTTVSKDLNSARWYAQVVSRSGMAANSIFVANAPGIIDPDYTGELKVLLYNGGHEAHYVKHGDRIAQLLLTASPIFTARWLDIEMPKTERGEKGFGSTGR